MPNFGSVNGSIIGGIILAVVGGFFTVLGYWKRRAATAEVQNVNLKQEVAHDDHVQAVQQKTPDQVASDIDQLTDPKPGGNGTGGSGSSGQS